MSHKFDILKQDWISNTHDAIEFIENTLHSAPKEYEKEYHKLVTWIVNTNFNPWGFMPKGYENVINNPIDFKSFLHNLHHAMIDDGEMTFVKIKDHGSFIIFANENEDYFESLVEKHLDSLAKTIKNHYESTANLIEKTDDEKLKQLHKKRLSTMPKSLKDLKYTYHTNVDFFIESIETYHKEQFEKHAKIDNIMRKMRM